MAINSYDIYDLKEQRYLLKDVKNCQVGKYFKHAQFPAGYYARKKIVYDGRYCITRSGEEIFGRFTLRNNENKMSPALAEEWEKVTKSIRDKVEWVKLDGKGARRISL